MIKQPRLTSKLLSLEATHGKWISFLLLTFFLSACHEKDFPDGITIERQILSTYHLAKDFIDPYLLSEIVADINCADSIVLGKRLVLAEQFHSSDTNEIMLIPFVSNGALFKSSAYSDVANRFILVNPTFIRQFALKNTINDTSSYRPVLELMLLHEIGHFILREGGAFDNILDSSKETTGQQKYNTEPEYLTKMKRIELTADSLAIDLIRRKLKSHKYDCLNIAFDIERVVPGMQFQLSGMRILENFGAKDIGFLHDPSNDHPNLELRITFMNYFLFPGDSLRKMIDDYLYDRTVAPVHQQELDIRIFQGQTKQL